MIELILWIFLFALCDILVLFWIVDDVVDDA